MNFPQPKHQLTAKGWNSPWPGQDKDDFDRALQRTANEAQQLQPQPPFFEALTHKTIVLGQLLSQIEHVTSSVRSRVFGAPVRNQRGDEAAGTEPTAPSMYDATMITMDDMIEVARRALHDAEALHSNL